MTQVEVALIHTSPEAFVDAQICYLTSVAEHKTVIALPVSLASVRIQRMPIWTLNPNIGIIKLFKYLASSKFFALGLQKADAVMFFLLEVVRNLTVLAIDPGFGTCLQVFMQIAVAYL